MSLVNWNAERVIRNLILCSDRFIRLNKKLETSGVSTAAIDAARDGLQAAIDVASTYLKYGSGLTLRSTRKK